MAIQDIVYGIGKFGENAIGGLKYMMERADKQSKAAEEMRVKERGLEMDETLRRLQLKLQEDENKSKAARRTASISIDQAKLPGELSGMKSREEKNRADTGLKGAQKEKTEVETDIIRKTGKSPSVSSADARAAEADRRFWATQQKQVIDDVLDDARSSHQAYVRAMGGSAKAAAALVRRKEIEAALTEQQKAARDQYLADAENAVTIMRKYGVSLRLPHEGSSTADPPSRGRPKPTQPPKAQSAPTPAAAPPPAPAQASPAQESELDRARRRAMELRKSRGGFLQQPFTIPEFMQPPMNQELMRRLQAARTFSRGVS